MKMKTMISRFQETIKPFHMNIHKRTINVFLLLAVLLGTGACRFPRCPMDNCHIRMKHRHPSAMGKGGEAPLVYDVNAGPEANMGKVYRGTPWWQTFRDDKVNPGRKKHMRTRTKDPKIAQGYKPGFKYKHKDTKPWGERMAKYKKKRIADDEKAARREGKKAAKDSLETGNGQENEEMDRQLREAEKGLEPDTGAGISETEMPAEKSKKARKSKKKQDRKKQEKTRQQEKPPEPEEEKDDF